MILPKPTGVPENLKEHLRELFREAHENIETPPGMKTGHRNKEREAREDRARAQIAALVSTRLSTWQHIALLTTAVGALATGIAQLVKLFM